MALGLSGLASGLAVIVGSVVVMILWVVVLLDLFRRSDLTTAKIVLWIVVIVLVPLLGAIVYLLVRSPATIWREMHTTNPREHPLGDPRAPG